MKIISREISKTKGNRAQLKVFLKKQKDSIDWVRRSVNEELLERLYGYKTSLEERINLLMQSDKMEDQILGKQLNELFHDELIDTVVDLLC